MRAAAAMTGGFLAVACGVHARAQETQAEPSPAGPTPAQTSDRSRLGTSTTGGAGGAAGVRSRVRSGGAGCGPMTKGRHGGWRGRRSSRRAAGRWGRSACETRLVNVALNVVDAHGAPVGGFEKKDFAIFEDGKPQTIAVFEREATSPLSIVLAIDSSETVLTSERLEKEAAKHFVRAILREQDELDLMDFCRHGARDCAVYQPGEAH